MKTISDLAVLSIPIHDNSEAMVDLRDCAEFVAHPYNSELPTDSLHVREALAHKLQAAQKNLNGEYKLMLVEGLRPLTLQTAYFNEYAGELRRVHPHWSELQLYTEASKYIAPPDITPPHSTGGAIDLTLCTPDGVELDMGAPLNSTPEETANAVFTHTDTLSPEAKQHREILCHALNSVGLVNYPYEYWHWSYGDRYWAYVTNNPHAIYGPVID